MQASRITPPWRGSRRDKGEARSRAGGGETPSLRGSSKSDMGRRGSATINPGYPVYRVFLVEKTGLTEHGPCSRKAANVRCFTLE